MLVIVSATKRSPVSAPLRDRLAAEALRVGAAGQFVPQCPSSTGRPSLTPHQHAEALKHLTKRRDHLIRHIAKNDKVDELARSL
jgi:hypothetical protein